MNLLEFLGVFGGLALFLHGMQMMSSGLEAVAGNRMKAILERLTANRFMATLTLGLVSSSWRTTSMERTAPWRSRRIRIASR